jgi:hypothetical protein
MKSYLIGSILSSVMPPIATIGNEGLMFFNVAIIDGPTGALKIKSLGLALEMRKNIIIRIWNMLIILELDLCLQQYFEQ